jgi:hypothetical protein
MHKRNITIIALLVAAIVSLLFLVVKPITTNYVIAYIFVLIGVIGLWLSALEIVTRKTGYPWTVAIPDTILRYGVWALVVFLGNLALEQLADWSMPVLWFLLIELSLLALYAIRLMALISGRDHIDTRDGQAQGQTSFVKALVVELELAIGQTEESGLREELGKLLEQTRYSDPVSPRALESLEQEIAAAIADLKNIVRFEPVETAIKKVKALQAQVAERNKKCLMLK